MLIPSFAEEKALWAQGYQRVAGLDEVGRGALAGPVVAAAVIMPRSLRASWLGDVRDSKQLTPAQRERLSKFIHKRAVTLGVGVVSNLVIDSAGILPATRLAMKLALEQLSPPADYLLIDFMKLPEMPLPQKGVPDGDSLCFSIACASIVAKVHRDHLMTGLAREYPGYGFEQHKGYGTEEHLACLARLGPCYIHRRSFAPVEGSSQ